MPSTRELEDTLPLTAPISDQDTTNLIGRKYAVYTLLDLSSEQLAQATDELNNNENNAGPGDCQLAPQPKFPGKTLRDIYEHHNGTRDDDKSRGIFHPLYFIVIDQEGWNEHGVLFVNLEVVNDNNQKVVGVCRCGIDMANSVGANLEIANMDWMDFKEMECDEWDGENPYDNPRYHESDSKEESASDHLQKFAWYSAVRKAGPISEMLEPNWTSQKRGESRFWFRGIAGEELFEVRKEHPFTCLVDHEIHQQLVLVAEKEDAEDQDGVALCRLLWDGDLYGYAYDDSTHDSRERDRAKARKIMPEIVVLEKAKASEALEKLDIFVHPSDSCRLPSASRLAKVAN